MSALGAEIWFLGRDRAAVFWLCLAVIVTSVALASGLIEISSQRAAIERLVQADRADRQAVLDKQKDWGGAAYYTFHLTYDAPSQLAFAAVGQRDVAPWKHRIRMLALEGQIYEADADNPTFALIGRFDFAFVVSMLIPLFVIFLLHALRANEREAGRFELLLATAAYPSRLWLVRASLRLGALALGVIVPFFVVGLWGGTAASELGGACLPVLLHIMFWGVLAEIVGRRFTSSAASLTVLIGLWVVFAVLMPAAIKVVVERTVPVIEGGDILLAQRESVNDAWDLPKSATMEPFVERHPQWRDYAEVKRPFEWKWYFAFQQVGDQTVEEMSAADRLSRGRRDRLVGWLSLLSPPTWLERRLQALARTDVQAALVYERSVRAFHAQLRAFYYPLLFEERPFDRSTFRGLPRFHVERGERQTSL